MAVETAEAMASPETEPQEKPDIPKIMAGIRARIEADLAGTRDPRRPLKPFAADFNAASKSAGELDTSENLRFLNTHYENGLRLDLGVITTHRPGFIGNLIVRSKRKVLGLLWNHLIKYYVHSEKEYQSNLIRYLNEVSKYIDARDASNFWELIRKIDFDVTKALTRIERINDEQTGTIRSSERRLFEELSKTQRDLSELRNEVVLQNERVKVVESVASGLERIVGRMSDSGLPVNDQAGRSNQGGLADPKYLMLENRFRGSEEEIRRRVSIYPEFFKGSTRPILEIGPGRGELQSLLRDKQIPSYGIDLDRAMVEAAKEKGFDVREGNALVHLRELADGALGGVIAVQVVEHLTRDQLADLFALCRTKVAKGGTIIFETINPRSVLALSSNYFRDPTHVWPLHPDTLSYSMTLAGLKVKEIKLLSPVDSGAMLKSVPVEEFMTPRWAAAIENMNRNFDQLNELLYGFQDFCVVAVVE